MLSKCFILYILSSQLVSNAAISNLKLELIQVLFRHGARTPTSAEASCINAINPYSVVHPYNEEIYLSQQGYGQLTTEGKEKSRKLGSLLRKNYDEFLGAYNPEEHYAASTSFNRTIISLQSTLAGIFPTMPADTWNNTIHHVSLDVNGIMFLQKRNHNYSLDVDLTLMPYVAGTYMDLYFETITNSTEYQQKWSKYTKFVELVEKEMTFEYNYIFSPIYTIAWTYTALEYYISNNLTLPPWTIYMSSKYHASQNLTRPSWYKDDSSFKTLAEVFKLALDGMSWTQQLRKRNGGVLVRQFIDNIKNNRQATSPKKMYLYCAHDMSLHAFLKAQNFEAFSIPPYSGALIMEKYKDSQKSEYVRMLTWNAVDENFKVVRIGNCDEFCPFTDYLKIVENNVSSDEYLANLKNNTKIETEYHFYKPLVT